MNYRYEEKYLISHRQYEIIKKRLEKLLYMDSHTSSNNHYLVRSIYFDDYIKKSVNDNLQGLKERFKYRIRTYNLNTDEIKLEKKIKVNEQGYKEKIKLNSAEYYELIQGKWNLLEKRSETLAQEMVISMKAKLLRPIIQIEYDREPFIMDFNDIRITFDKNIVYSTSRFGLNEPIFTSPVLDEIVLEIKYNHYLPTYLKKIFFTDSVQKMSISKYIICYLDSKAEDFII